MEQLVFFGVAKKTA